MIAHDSPSLFEALPTVRVTLALTSRVSRLSKGRGIRSDLHDAAARFPRRRQERIHNGQGAEYIDLELMPDGTERQAFQRAGSENACVVDQEIKAATSK